jgi:hypothetical protein
LFRPEYKTKSISSIFMIHRSRGIIEIVIPPRKKNFSTTRGNAQRPADIVHDVISDCSKKTEGGCFRVQTAQVKTSIELDEELSAQIERTGSLARRDPAKIL